MNTAIQNHAPAFGFNIVDAETVILIVGIATVFAGMLSVFA